MIRKCDNCGKVYDADERNINRGWGLCCSKSCAAKKREKSKPSYNARRVKEYTNIIIWYRYHFTQYYQKNMNERTIRYSLKLTKKTRNNSIKCKLERKWVCRIIKRYRKEKEK